MLPCQVFYLCVAQSLFPSLSVIYVCGGRFPLVGVARSGFADFICLALSSHYGSWVGIKCNFFLIWGIGCAFILQSCWSLFLFLGSLSGEPELQTCLVLFVAFGVRCLAAWRPILWRSFAGHTCGCEVCL